MFDTCRDDVLLASRFAVTGKTEYGQVVALGRTAREDDLLGLRRHDCCHFLAGAADSVLRDLTVAVGATAGVAELVTHEGHYLVRHPRIDWSRGVEVQVCRAEWRGAVGLVGRQSYGHAMQHSSGYEQSFGTKPASCSE